MKRSSFAGIAQQRICFAEKIAELEKISSLEVLLCEVQTNPEYPITTSLPSEQYADKGLILIDDVLNSGTT
jgi:pyrimidine operon attenuation protein/uracil phosphoribosyltransferase